MIKYINIINLYINITMINTKIININSFDEINENDLTDAIIYINIDKGCLMPEYLIAQVYNNNPFIRNKIIKNTKLIKFNYTNKLIPTRYNFPNFINNKTNKIKELIYVITSNHSDELINNLQEYNLPINRIININEMNKEINILNNKIIYIDGNLDIIEYINTLNFDSLKQIQTDGEKQNFALSLEKNNILFHDIDKLIIYKLNIFN